MAPTSSINSVVFAVRSPQHSLHSLNVCPSFSETHFTALISDSSHPLLICALRVGARGLEPPQGPPGKGDLLGASARPRLLFRL